jgi:hypothetical protein
MQHWLKAIGHARGPLPRLWIAGARDGSLQRTGFPRRPRIAAGDRLVYYASVWRVAFAAVEVTGDPEETRPGTRWPWTVAVEPLLVLPDLERAPPVESFGILPRSMSQQSHIRLSGHQYAHAVEAMTSVAL